MKHEKSLRVPLNTIFIKAKFDNNLINAFLQQIHIDKWHIALDKNKHLSM